MQNAINKFFARLAVDSRGLTAVEYAVLGGIIVAGLAATGTSLGGALTTKLAGLLTVTTS